MGVRVPCFTTLHALWFNDRTPFFKKKLDSLEGRRIFISVNSNESQGGHMPKKSKKKKDPERAKFRKSITIDGEDSYAVYYTPAMERKIKELREKDLQEEREIRRARSSGSSGS